MTTLPPPVVINHPVVFGIGTGLWAIALAVMVVLDLTGTYQARVWIWVCAVGVVLGIAATVYSKFSWRARRD
ncbi:MAG: DUF2530 domain-containing protein [Bifidobacteriaceae bacterium]|nr:DUF2530 domain-containing protein [Bifidobacteriaceae bacterium]